MTSLPAPSRLTSRSFPEELVPLALFMITMLAILLRLFRLGHPSFWVDELITIWQGSVEGYTLWQQFLDDLQNPLTTVVVTWIRGISEAEVVARLPGALLGALSPLWLYRVGDRLLGPRAGLFAALLLAVHPMHIQHSQEVRGYPYLLFFGLVATDLALGAQGRLSWRRGLALLAMGVAATLSNLQGLFWMGGLALGLLIGGRLQASHLLRWGICFGLMVVLTANWWGKSLGVHESDRILPGQSTGEPLRGGTTFSAWSLPYAGFVLTAGEGFGPSTREMHQREYRDGSGAVRGVFVEHLPRIAVAGALVCFLVAFGVAGGRRVLPQLIAWSAFTLLLAILLAARNVKPFNPRYVFAILPSVLLLFGAGLAWLSPRPALFLLVGWLGICGVSLQRQYFDERYANEDVRAAAALVAEREGVDDVVVVPTVFRVFEHYYRGGNPVRNLFGHVLPGEQAVRDQLATIEPQRRFLWYVRSRPWFGDPEGHVLSVLEADHREVARFQVPGVELLLFDRTRAPAVPTLD